MVKEFISLDDYFMCRSTNPNHAAYGADFRDVSPYAEELTDEIVEQATELVKKVNSLFTEIEQETNRQFTLTITSGWRPKKYSAELGLSTRSYHCKGMAIDLADLGNAMKDTIESNARTSTPNDWLTVKGMWMEHKSATPTWCHLDIGDRWARPVRIFLP